MDLALTAEFKFMSCQNYTDIYTNGKTLKRRRECVFRGEVKKTMITVCEALINFLTLREGVRRGRPQCIEKIRALR